MASGAGSKVPAGGASGTSERPLAGRRVLLTREPERAGAYRALLEDAGARVDCVPVTRIEPIASADQAARAPAFPWAGAWLVVTSARIATFLPGALAACGQGLGALRDVLIAAVGPATAQALIESGLSPGLVAAQATGVGLAEALAAQLGDLRDLRVIWPRQEAGRVELGERLVSQGARVEPWDLYRARPVPVAELSSSLAPLMSGGVDLVVCFAPSQVDALHAAAAPALARARLVALGATTAAAFSERGLVVAGQADAPRPEDVLRAILVAEESCQSSPP